MFPFPAAHSDLAQLVEQAAVNRRVAGSSPAVGAKVPHTAKPVVHGLAAAVLGPRPQVGVKSAAGVTEVAPLYVIRADT